MRIIGDGGHAKVVRDVIARTCDAGPRFCIIAIGNNADRKKEVERQPHGTKFWITVHPKAIVPYDELIGEGTVIMAGAVIQPGCKIGKHVIINTGATVDHDCVIGDYAHIAPGAHLCGHVEVGEGALVGAGVCVAPMGKIPAWTLAKMRRLELVPLSGN